MDIQKTLTDLNKTLTDYQIGKEIGASQSVVNRLRNGIHKTTYADRYEAIKVLAERYGLQT